MKCHLPFQGRQEWQTQICCFLLDFFNLGFNDFLNEYTDSDADIVYFNANSVDTDTYEPSNRVDHLHGFIEEYHKDKNKGELIMRYLFTEPWCKMVKREIIESHHLKFEETSIRNDVRYSYLVGHYAAKIIVDDRQLYWEEPQVYIHR